jgi:hypothetical protein
MVLVGAKIHPEGLSLRRNPSDGYVLEANPPPGWQQIAKNDIDNPSDFALFPLTNFNGRQYFWTPDMGSDGTAPAVPVWSYDGATFTRANTDGFGLNGESVSTAVVFQGRIHLVVARSQQMGPDLPLMPLACAGGTTWTPTGPEGFGDDVTDIELIDERAGRTEADRRAWFVMVDQKLGGCRGAYLSAASRLDYDDRRARQLAFDHHRISGRSSRSATIKDLLDGRHLLTGGTDEPDHQ